MSRSTEVLAADLRSRLGMFAAKEGDSPEMDI
jgi:hypothetical protein